MNRPLSVASVIALIAIILSALACGPAKSAEDTGIITMPVSGAPEAKLTKELIKPVISSDGGGNALMGALFIDFPYVMVESGQVGKPVGTDTVIRITPAADGQWQWESSSRLRFGFKKQAAFGATYTVQLLKISTKDGAFSWSDTEAWKSTLDTPAFTLLDGLLQSYDPNQPAAIVLFSFSGPVSLDSVKKSARFTVGGAAVAPQNWEIDAQSRVRVRLAGWQLAPGRELSVRLGADISSGDGSAKTKTAWDGTFGLDPRSELDVKGVQVKESNQGFYVDVVINDPEEWSGRDEMWENRCSINADTAGAFVRFSPSLKVTALGVKYGLRLFGDFKRGQYKLKLLPGLSSTRGSALAAEYAASVDIPARRPTVSFLSKGRFLPREFVKYIPVTHTNVSALKISIRQIYEQNIVHWFSSSSEQPDHRLSDLVAEKFYAVKKVDDAPLLSWIDISTLLPANKKGVFEITAGAEQSGDVLRLNLTRLGLVAKSWGDRGQHFNFYVFDTVTMNPVPGAEVTLHSVSNQVLYRGATDARGLLEVRDAVDPTMSRNPPFAALVAKDDDLLAVRISDVRVAKEDYDVKGDNYDAASPYQAHIWSECGVYRPGEKASFGVIVRTKTFDAPPDKLPLTAKLRDPRDKVLTVMSGTANAAGLAEFRAEFNPYADTGKYQLELEVGGAKVGAYAFNVEEFVPERMKVTVREKGDFFLQSAPVPFRVEARYLFGAPAANAKAEVSYSLESNTFSPPNNKEYSYAVHRTSPLKPISLGTVTQTLKADGTIDLSSPVIEQAANFKGGARLIIDAAVFESGSGRTTVGRREIVVHPASRYLGLKASQKTLNYGQEADIAGVIVDLTGKTIETNDKVQVSVIALQSEWVWEYDREGYDYTYTRYLRQEPMRNLALTADKGRFQARVKADVYADGYLIEARLGARVVTSIFLKSDSYSDYYQAARGDSQTPRPLQPESIAIEAPREVRVGQGAQITIRPPFPGRLLLTQETKGVLESHWFDVKPEPTSIPFTVKEFWPNVYLSVYLIRHASADGSLAFVPGAAYGVTSIAVVPEEYQLLPKITAPAEVRPNKPLAVSIDCGRRGEKTFVAVAVVDEGILQLTKFQTPDPARTFFRQRLLGVDTFETLGWTLKLPQLRLLSPSGGEDAAKSRVMPVKPLVLWSGIREVPDSGKIDLTFNIPEYSGRVRVMATAVSKKRQGWAEADVTVRDPIVAQSTFPRFASPDDTFRVPVAVTNLTGRNGQFTVALSLSGGAKLKGDAQKTLALNNTASGTVTYDIAVTGVAGRADFEVTVSGAGEKTSQKSTVPIVPNAPETTETYMVPLQNGANDLTKYFSGWKPQYELASSVWITPNKYGDQFTHLKWLIQYPYGCIEQTTSSTRPLLFIGDLVVNLSANEGGPASIAEKFMFGANRLLSMQTESGGFAYWPGDQHPSVWGTPYAAHCLIQGMKLGYPIPKERVNAALTFMEKLVDGDTSALGYDYGYYLSGTKPYMLYVLALGGKPKVGAITQLIKNPDKNWYEMSEENLFLLKAALYLTGDRTYERDLKAVNTTVSPDRRNNWYYWSDLRTKGLMLDVLEDLFPGDPVCVRLADSIASMLATKNHHSYTTQDLVWSVSGLGKHVRNLTVGSLNAGLTVAGKTVAPSRRTENQTIKEFFFNTTGASGAGSVAVNASFPAGSRVYATVLISGIKPGTAFRTGSSSITVSRTLHDAEGNGVEYGGIRLGDMVVVEVSLTNHTDRDIMNVALVDRFAAGLEIENPRLNRQFVTDWYDEDDIWKIDYMDMKDDRIRWFGKLPARETVKLYYILRAVTRGTFASPPTSAEAMYDPAVWATDLNPAAVIGEPR